MNIIKYFTLIFLVGGFLYSLAFADEYREAEIGIEEMRGNYLPLDAEFVTSNGDTVKLGDILERPVLLDVVYYNCPGICHPLLQELTWAVDRLNMTPGKDFEIITLSFNPKETFKDARKWKRSYLSSMNRPFPDSAWYFLTGDSSNISKVTKSVGFNYQPREDEYVHAGCIIAISPEGKISRYIYGDTFNPFDLQMALIDAQNEKVRPTSAKLLQFCFSYDPEGRRYTLNVTRIFGGITLIGIFVFLVFIVFKRKNKEI